MAATLSYGRSFERSLRQPAPRAGAGDQDSARKYFYERLMQISYRHTYYNREDGACPDFVAMPTPSTTALMRSLGLLFKNERTGFSVFYDTRRRREILNYLRRQAGDGQSDPRRRFEVWTRLSFVLVLDQPWFFSFTELPLGTNPAQKNFYFSNTQAHAVRGVPVLNTGRHVTAEELLEVASTQVTVRTPQSVERVEVRDIAGGVVECVPRCVRRRAARRQDPDALTCRDAAIPQPGDTVVCRDQVEIDFSLLPEDKYVLESVGTAGLVKSWTVLYTQARPQPVAFIDLLFTQPRAGVGEADLYPVRDLFPSPSDPDRARIEGVGYQLRFEARSSLWDYYIVPQDPAERLENLSIEAPPPLAFPGPVEVVLANGARAYLFESNQPIVLQQQSDAHFRLYGRRALMSSDGVLMDRLPVASVQQVQPAGRDPLLAAPRPVPAARRRAARRAARTAEADTHADIIVYV